MESDETLLGPRQSLPQPHPPPRRLLSTIEPDQQKRESYQAQRVDHGRLLQSQKFKGKRQVSFANDINPRPPALQPTSGGPRDAKGFNPSGARTMPQIRGHRLQNSYKNPAKVASLKARLDERRRAAAEVDAWQPLGYPENFDANAAPIVAGPVPHSVFRQEAVLKTIKELKFDPSAVNEPDLLDVRQREAASKCLNIPRHHQRYQGLEKVEAQVTVKPRRVPKQLNPSWVSSLQAKPDINNVYARPDEVASYKPTKEQLFKPTFSLRYSQEAIDRDLESIRDREYAPIHLDQVLRYL